MNHASGQFFSFLKRLFRQRYAPWLLGFFLITLPGITPAQNVSKLKEEGDGYFQKEQFYQAAQYYQVAVGLAPDDPLINYRLAESYREIFNYPLAASYYQATLGIDPFGYPLALFYLARMNKAIGQFQLAKNQFDSFVKRYQNSAILEEPDRGRYVAQAQIEAQGCQWAMQQMSAVFNEQGFVNLPQPVNTAFNDYAATIFEHDSSITITSGRRGAKGALIDNRYGDYFTDNINFSKATDWQRADFQSRFETVNTKFSDGAGCYNQERTTYYFTSCYEGNAFCQLYATRLTNNRWSRPKPLDQQINLPGYDNRHPAISPSGDTLYFTSNRPGGKGGNDIWMSKSDGSGGWQAPKLVPNVNTPFNEVAPFLSDDGTLFFSSDGHVGFGGMDIFSISPLSPSPQNLGIPLNSGFDDTFFTVGDKLGYLSSNRTGGAGKFDVYQFPWPGSAQALAEQFKGEADGAQLRSRIRQYSNRNLVAARDEDQFYYDNLTAEERAQIDRILAARRLSGTYFNPLTLAPDDFKYYQKLDIETKAIIERLAQREIQKLQGLDEFGNASVNLLEPADLEYYEGVSSEERAIIDRIIAAKVDDRKETLASLDPNQRDYWETSPAPTQNRIESQALDLNWDQQEQELSAQNAQLDRQVQQNRTLLDTQAQLAAAPQPAIANQLATNYGETVEQLSWPEQVFYQQLDGTQKDHLHKLALKRYLENSNLDPAARQAMIEQFNLSQGDQLSESFSQSQRVKLESLVTALSKGLMNQSDSLPPELLETFQQLSTEEQLVLELQAQQNLLQTAAEQSIEAQVEVKSIRSELQDQQQSPGPLNPEQQQTEQALAQEFSERAKTFGIRKLQPRDLYFFNALSPAQTAQIQKLTAAIIRGEQQGLYLDQQLASSLTAVDKAYFQSLPVEEQELLEHIISNGLQSGDEATQLYLSQLDEAQISRVQRLRAQYLQTQQSDLPATNLVAWNPSDHPQLSEASLEFLNVQPPELQDEIASILQKGLDQPQLLTPAAQDYLESLSPTQKMQLQQAVNEFQPPDIIAQPTLNNSLSEQDRSYIAQLPQTFQTDFMQLMEVQTKPSLVQLKALPSWPSLSPQEQARVIQLAGLEETVPQYADTSIEIDELSTAELAFLNGLDPVQKQEIKTWLDQPDEFTLEQIYTPTQLQRLNAIKSSYQQNAGLSAPDQIPAEVPDGMESWYLELPANSKAQLSKLDPQQMSMISEITAQGSLNFEEYQGATRRYLESRSLAELQGIQQMIDVYAKTYPNRIPAQYRQGPTLISGQLNDLSLTPLARQTVVLIDQNGAEISRVVSDNLGRFEFTLPHYQQPHTIKVQDHSSFLVDRWSITESGPSASPLSNAQEDSLSKTGEVASNTNAETPTKDSEPNQIITSTTAQENQQHPAIVYFDFDRYQLRPEAKKTVEAMASFLQDNQSAEVLVGGHTDYVGPSGYNQKLSERRSQAAADYLTSLVSGVRTRIQGFGESRPQYSNRTSYGRQYNRRVEFLIKAPRIYQAPMRTVLIKPGVSLGTLARNLGVSEEVILAWNGTTSRRFRPYQPIRLPAATDFEQYHRLVFDPASKSDDYQQARYHTVKFGETLFRLAARYDTTVERLEELNQIRARDLKAGSKIRVR